MKIKRQKHAKKNVGFYKHNFGFREPFQVLLDGTFCQAALRNKIQIREQLPGYLAGATQLCTTRHAQKNSSFTTETISYLKTMKHLLSSFVPSSFLLILVTTSTIFLLQPITF
uniref:UTP23 small subunit processome component n=1 Tax=Podarcis muralis TaxID=64176 RepID=A0A670K0U7_PODMU